MTTALIPLADGVEEMEAVIVLDVLRRAGWKAVGATVDGLTVKGSRGVGLLADMAWNDARAGEYDVLAIPGGMGGTNRLMKHAGVLEAVRRHADAGKLVGAICAGPLVLQAAGILAGKRATSHPGVRDRLTEARACDDRVAVDGRIVTSQGPGTAIAFALKLIELGDGAAAARSVADGLVA